MPLSVNAQFERYSGRSPRNSIHVLYIPSLAAYWSTERVEGLTTSTILLERPALAQQQVDLLEGTTSSGGIVCEVQNGGGRVEAALVRGLLQREAVLYEGFRGLPWDAYVARHTGLIYSSALRSDGTSWTLNISGRLSQIDREKLRPEDYGAELCTAAGTSRTWTVTCPSLREVTLTITATGEDAVYDSLTLEGNAFEIALCLLLSGGDSELAYNGLPVWAGAGLGESEVNVAAWEAAADLWQVFDVSFTYTDARNIRSFLESQICKVFGGYLHQSGDGKIGIKLPTIPSLADDIEELTDSEIVTQPVVVEDGSRLVSHVQFKLDWDGSDYQTVLPPMATTPWLLGDVRAERIHEIESQGLHTSSGGIVVARIIMATLFQRFGNNPRRVTCRVQSTKSLLESGDTVKITSRLYPNADFGRALGKNQPRLAEIVSIRPGAVEMDLEMLDLTAAGAGIAEGARAGTIAPTGQADYPSATDAERAYAYVADVTTGKLSTGAPGYLIG